MPCDEEQRHVHCAHSNSDCSKQCEQMYSVTCRLASPGLDTHHFDWAPTTAFHVEPAYTHKFPSPIYELHSP